MRHLLILAALGAALPAQAPFNLTDGNASFGLTSYATSATDAGGYGNFAANGTDHLYQNSWYYCVSGDTRGSAFNSSNGQLVVTPHQDGRSASMDWANVDGRNFAAQLVSCVYSTGPTTGVCTQTMAITNNTGVALGITVYNYCDFDVSASPGSDSAQQVQNGTPGHQMITDGTTNATVYFLADAFVGHEVASFAGLRANILAGQGGTCYPLTNAGLPFGPGDYTGAYQWSLAISPSQTVYFKILLADGILPVSANSAAAVPFGVAKAGTPGFPGWGTQRPFAGSRPDLQIKNGLPGAVPLLLIGASQLNLPFPPFGIIYVNPLITVSMPPFDAAMQSSIPIPIPMVRQGGAYFQALWADPAASGGIVHTEGLTWAIGSY